MKTATLLADVENTLLALGSLPSPFGDGRATERIAAHIHSVVADLFTEEA